MQPSFKIHLGQFVTAEIVNACGETRKFGDPFVETGAALKTHSDACPVCLEHVQTRDVKVVDYERSLGVR